MALAIATHILTKQFPGVTAVEGLQLTIAAGEMFALVGPDGAGKTTTIRLLCGILAPTSGSATVLGYDIVQQPEQVKSRIGYLSQKFSLYGDLSVDENLQFFAEIHQVYDFKKQREELLAFTRLTPFRDRPAENLSGGMKKKLALACTLIHRPRILFLDEPTTGVDPVSRREFWRILQSLLQQGITIVMATPYLDEAERCTRVGLMDRGRLLVVDTPENLKQGLPGELLEIVCENVRQGLRVLQQLPEVVEVQAFGDRLKVRVKDHTRDLPPIEAALHAQGIAITNRRVIRPSLENVFIALVTRQQHDEDRP